MERFQGGDLYVPLVEAQGSSAPTENGELRMQGLRTPGWKAALYVVLCVATAGVFFLLSRWILQLRVLVLYSRCSLASADHVLVEEVSSEGGAEVADERTEFVEPVVRLHDRRYFVHKGLRHVIEEDRFVCFEYPVVQASFGDIHQRAETVLSDDARAELHGKFGPNKMEVPMPTVVELLVDELLHPFYIFQIVSVIIWIMQFYFIYAGTIFVLATAALIFSVIQTRRNNQALADMAAHSSTVNVARHGKTVMVDSKQLVPGDVVVLEASSGRAVACDMIVLEGEVVANESSLTGESVPVVKTPLPRAQAATEPNFDFGAHARHVLFCGTDLRRVKGTARALVVRTGYQTAKGALIRQILYPKPSVFPFYRDALIFIFVLFLVTLGAFGWAIWKFVSNGASWWFTTLRVLDLFTTVIPPALPIAMSAGASFAVLRLRQAGIFCVVPKTINIAGRVNVFAFDKTGTLTQDHLDVHCVRPAASDRAQFLGEVRHVGAAGISRPLLWALSSCHSVVRLSSQETIGDPLEVKMMQWTGWACSSFDDTKTSMMSPDCSQVVYTLMRHEFMSQLARMSVVVRGPDNDIWALAKGSPEELRRHCDPKTIPADFDSVLASYTAQGMRTIALAAKPMKEASMTERDEVESNLSFLGFLVMVNPLKPETPELLQVLQEARIRVIMITGDNALTAVNVARKAGMTRGSSTRLIEYENGELRMTVVRQEAMEAGRPGAVWSDVLANDDDELAMTGAAFANLAETQSPFFVQNVMRSTSVYARTNPLQKTQIVTLLKHNGVNTVGMCGDGANDCGALKAADCGLSISDGEAAIAAPFSANSILAVRTLLLEGRGALATSFALFKFMIMYSVIQTTAVMLCYVFLNLLADLQFLWVDLFLILPLSFAMGLTRPDVKLVNTRPPATLFRLSVLMSVVGHVLFMIAVYSGAVVWSQMQPWVDNTNQPIGLVNGTTPFVSVAVSTVFLFGNFLYLGYSFIFSIGYPFRQPFYYNPLLLLALLGATVCNIVWVFVQSSAIIRFWSLIAMPYDFLGPLFGLACGFVVFSYLYEVVCVVVVQGREGRIENKPQ